MFEPFDATGGQIGRQGYFYITFYQQGSVFYTNRYTGA